MKDKNHVYDMIIIGGGPAGYTAALYAARAGFDTLVLELLSAGGQMALTNQIDNYPGFEDGIDGFSLGEKMKSKLKKWLRPFLFTIGGALVGLGYYYVVGCSTWNFLSDKTKRKPPALGNFR